VERDSDQSINALKLKEFVSLIETKEDGREKGKIK